MVVGFEDGGANGRKTGSFSLAGRKGWMCVVCTMCVVWSGGDGICSTAFSAWQKIHF